jgi:hypothetical protein
MSQWLTGEWEVNDALLQGLAVVVVVVVVHQGKDRTAGMERGRSELKMRENRDEFGFASEEDQSRRLCQSCRQVQVLTCSE